jgi:hypothetical protein
MTTNPSAAQVEANVVICGVEQPKRIWLFAYRHAGDVCWSSDPNPEDTDEIEAVEYVRGDLAAMPKPAEIDAVKVLELLRLARRFVDNGGYPTDPGVKLLQEQIDAVLAAQTPTEPSEGEMR